MELVGNHDDGTLPQLAQDALAELNNSANQYDKTIGNSRKYRFKLFRTTDENVKTRSQKGRSVGASFTYQMAADMRVDGTQRIIHQHDFRVTIHSPSNRNALLLPATEIHAALADFRGVARTEDSKIYTLR